MAAPFDREPRPGKGAGGDVLALWAERNGRRRADAPGWMPAFRGQSRRAPAGGG